MCYIRIGLPTFTM